MFQEIFKGILRKFQGCIKEDGMLCHGNFKWVLSDLKKFQREFQGNFIDVQASRKFQGCFK